MTKPFAESSEQNKQPILDVLKDLFTNPGTVLEIGSGTGQHAVHFSRSLPHISWQPSDVGANLAGIRAWCDEAGLSNLLVPIELDVGKQWPDATYHYVFSANTAHIMSWPEVEAMIKGVATVLHEKGLFALYGPFSFDGQHTAASNAQFDTWLKQRDPDSGVRDFAELNTCAKNNNMAFVHDYAMPVNNRILVWRKN